MEKKPEKKAQRGGQGLRWKALEKRGREDGYRLERVQRELRG